MSVVLVGGFYAIMGLSALLYVLPTVHDAYAQLLAAGTFFVFCLLMLAV